MKAAILAGGKGTRLGKITKNIPKPMIKIGDLTVLEHQINLLKKDGIIIVTADHGNAESLIYRGSGEAETRHDDSPVPFYLFGKQYQTNRTSEIIAQAVADVSGILADVAPTILELMGIPQPAEMTGKSLLPVLGLK